MVRPSQQAGIHDFLERQRWFAGKGRDFSIEAIHSLGWLSPEGSWPAVRIELITVRYATGEGDEGGNTDVYQLPLAYRDRPVEALAHAVVGEWDHPELGIVWAYDALHDKEATTYWLRGLLDERAETDFAFHRTGDIGISGDEQSLALPAATSNTSLVFAEAAILKVFRRVHHGRNPDIVVHEAFARGGGRNVARLFGWLEAEWPVGEGGAKVDRGDLGMFSDFFRTASDGWELAITSVRDLYAEADLHADEVGGDFAAESHRLGATTAEVHQDLHRLLPTSAWGPIELAKVTDGMRGRLELAASIVPELASYADALRSAYDDLANHPEPVPVQRIHGDFHLGQTMRTVAGWRLIDFEGEPARAFAERDALDSTIRDVAGMLRSFDYAAQHLLTGQERPDALRGPGSDDHGQLEYRAQEWSERNRAAFCEGYASVAGSDPRAQGVLLRAYETDKAVYEIIYESRSRPDWVKIPLAAVRRLAGMGNGTGEEATAT
jgi:maltokinase